MKPLPLYRCFNLRLTNDTGQLVEMYGKCFVYPEVDVEMTGMLSEVRSYVILLLCYNCEQMLVSTIIKAEKRQHLFSHHLSAVDE